ncbi:hypothetical protein AURDEDRAFT_131657 [Auricularia subglabra TFB-10046 SS5]|uniref:F-box domain-containing protein n=1 Tax=Auricularia subglabra (strain TFB-10046 / SS5) TaxID=717982 RepID=J0WMD0_AURST|nr:hypothetical protein AURDEDRAFT_131657 [Auricularia subglabra TFB-10046 SS5]
MTCAATLDCATRLAAELSDADKPSVCPLCLLTFAVRLGCELQSHLSLLRAQSHALFDSCVKTLLLPRRDFDRLRARLATNRSRCQDRHSTDDQTFGTGYLHTLVDGLSQVIHAGLHQGERSAVSRASKPDKPFGDKQGRWPSRVEQLFPYGKAEAVDALLDLCDLCISAAPLGILNEFLWVSRSVVLSVLLARPDRIRIAQVLAQQIDPARLREIATTAPWLAKGDNELLASAVGFLQTVHFGPGAVPGDALELFAGAGDALVLAITARLRETSVSDPAIRVLGPIAMDLYTRTGFPPGITLPAHVIAWARAESESTKITFAHVLWVVGFIASKYREIEINYTQAALSFTPEDELGLREFVSVFGRRYRYIFNDGERMTFSAPNVETERQRATIVEREVPTMEKKEPPPPQSHNLSRIPLERALHVLLVPVGTELRARYGALGSDPDGQSSRYGLVCDASAVIERGVKTLLHPLLVDTNKRSLAFRLPDELWSIVFERLPPAERIHISQVCSRWSTVARGLPRLWSTLEFRPGDDPSLVEALVSRTRNADLSVTLNAFDGRYLSLLNRWAPDPDSPWARLRRLDVLQRSLAARAPRLPDGSPELILPEAPKLEELCVEGPGALVTEGNSAVALKRAHLIRVSVVCTTSLSAWPFLNLESLIWRPIPASYFLEDLALLLTGCRALRRLVVYGLSIGQRSPQDRIEMDLSERPLERVTLMGTSIEFAVGPVHGVFRRVPHVVWYDADVTAEAPDGFLGQVDCARTALVRSSLRTGEELRDSFGNKLYDLQVADVLRRQLLRIPEAERTLCRLAFTDHLVDLALPLEVWYGIGPMGDRPFFLLSRLALHEIDSMTGTQSPPPTCPSLRTIVLHEAADGGRSGDLCAFVAGLAQGCAYPLESLVFAARDPTAPNPSLEASRSTPGLERWARTVSVEFGDQSVARREQLSDEIDGEYAKLVLDGDGSRLDEGKNWQDMLEET